MTNQDLLNHAIQAVAVTNQNRMLKQQNAMLRNLIDRVDSMGDRLWQMDRRISDRSSWKAQTGGDEAPSCSREDCLPQARGKKA